MTLKIRLVTVAGNVDIDPPDDFEFGAVVSSIRLSGYFCSPTVFIPMTSILAIFVWDTDQVEMPMKPNVQSAGTLQ